MDSYTQNLVVGAGQADLDKKHPDSETLYHMVQRIEGIAKMEIRPTGLLDPEIEVRPTSGQIADLLSEINARNKKWRTNFSNCTND